jgi:hypothetical protein
VIAMSFDFGSMAQSKPARSRVEMIVGPKGGRRARSLLMAPRGRGGGGMCPMTEDVDVAPVARGGPLRASDEDLGIIRTDDTVAQIAADANQEIRSRLSRLTSRPRAKK